MLTGAEISKHSSRESCWVVIKDQAYDVTDFLDDHPGGSHIILKYAGKDATEEFDPIHPPDALASLPKEKHLGPVEVGTIAKVIQAETTNAKQADKAPLSSIITVGDLYSVAEATLKPKAWAYYKSAADDERTADWNVASWSHISLRPRVLRDITTVDLKTTILGFPSALPLFVCPAALAKLAHPDGEVAIARACGKMGLIYMLSTSASCSLEEVAAAALPGQTLFYQLYVNKDRSESEDRLRRVAAAGYKAIVLTVDAQVGGKRTRDERAKLVDLPPEDLGSAAVNAGDGKGASVASALFGWTDASLNWNDLEWLRKSTRLPIIVKGIQTAEDAALCASHGVQGILLSNHGGRQVEGAPSAVETLLEIRRHCPQVLRQCEVYVDGGIRKGTDVIKAVALGAKAAGVGRPALYSLIWGEEGTSKVLSIVADELSINMRLLGATAIGELGPQHVNTKRLEAQISDEFCDPTSLLDRIRSKL